MLCHNCAVSDELRYCDKYYQKQPTDQGTEGQCNDQDQVKREYYLDIQENSFRGMKFMIG